MALKLNVIIASTRPGRLGPAVGAWFNDFAAAHKTFETELVDLESFNLPLLNEPQHPSRQAYQHEETWAWSRSVAAADAYVFVTPEYDFFPNAALVNALQALSKEWAYKCAGLVSYGGVSGGLRSAQVVRQLISNLNMHALPQTVPLQFFAKMIGDDGVLRPPAPVADGATLMLNELHKWATALKPLRG